MYNSNVFLYINFRKGAICFENFSNYSGDDNLLSDHDDRDRYYLLQKKQKRK